MRIGVGYAELLAIQVVVVTAENRRVIEIIDENMSAVCGCFLSSPVVARSDYDLFGNNRIVDLQSASAETYFDCFGPLL